MPRTAAICCGSVFFRLQSSTMRSSRKTRLGGMSRDSARLSRQCHNSRAIASSRRFRPFSPETRRHRFLVKEAATSSIHVSISSCIHAARPRSASRVSSVFQSASRYRTSSSAYSICAGVSGLFRQSVRVSPLFVGCPRTRRTIDAYPAG